MSLAEFLSEAKAELAHLPPDAPVHVVIGNESCDLDSVVAALAYAHFLHQTSPSTLHLPLLNIPRTQFKVRLETIYFLNKHGIQPEALTFVDDLDLEDLVEQKGEKLTVTLVDHHVLSSSEENLRSRVVEVMDHRPQDGQMPSSWSSDIQRVGSCCTLVAQRMLVQGGPLGQDVVELLIGTIVTDTANMSEAANIGTPADEAAMAQLATHLPPDFSRDSIFEEIGEQKYNLASLTVHEMLTKDCKVLKGSHLTVVMSSITMPMDYVLGRPEFPSDAAHFLSAQGAHVVIIMTISLKMQQRHIAVFSLHRVFRQQITDVLLQSSTPNLECQPLDSPADENTKVFYQANFRISRKGVLPLVRDFLAGEPSSPDVNLNAVGDNDFFVSDASQEQDITEGDDQTRARMNLAKISLSEQWDSQRSSQDQFDLAAVGSQGILSPSLSSDSDFGDSFRKERDSAVRGDGFGSLLDLGEASSNLLVEISNTDKTDMPAINVIKEETGSGEGLLFENLLDVDSAENSQSMEVNIASTSDLLTLTDEASLGEGDNLPCNGLDNDTEVDFFHNEMPSDLLCPGAESPYSSMPTSGQTSGQGSGRGSKVHSVPETPPNSFMEASGAYFKETQLPSFNSSEMVRRIHEKKAKLPGHSGKASADSFGFYDNDDLLNGAVESSGGSGSLISPSVPSNSRMDLMDNGAMSSGYHLPNLSNSNMMEKVNEKLSNFEWSVDSPEMEAGMTNSEGTQPIAMSRSANDNVSFTPQNSFVDGSFDSYARSNLPSLNSAEMVARIKAKQSAMYGGSGGSSRVSHSSQGSDDGSGCRSPEMVQGKESRGLSSGSPQVAYTPQNSYRDGLSFMLDGRNRLPDLNEVAERLSVEGVGSKFRSNSGGGGGDNGNQQNAISYTAKKRNFSNSQSDSQNTMSDVDSMFSLSTDVCGTPIDNVVASSLAGAIKGDNHKDLDVVNNHSKVPISAQSPDGSFSFEKDSQIKADMFSPLEPEKVDNPEDRILFETAEDIVANSIAAAVAVNQTSSIEPIKQNVVSYAPLSPESKEDIVTDQALNEIAFELANEMIQAVLEDFPFPPEESNQPSLETNKSNSNNDNSPTITDNFDAVEPADALLDVDVSFGRRFSKSEDYIPRRCSREEDKTARGKDAAETQLTPTGLETEYMPHMVDPLQGSLDIVSNESSFIQLTGGDQEVAEGESFRKVSSQEYKDDMFLQWSKSSAGAKESVEPNDMKVKSNQNASIEEVDGRDNNAGILASPNNGSEQAGTSISNFSKHEDNQKKRIRVSFSQDDSDSDFSSERRAVLKSPSPPPLTASPNFPSSPHDEPLAEQFDDDDRDAASSEREFGTCGEAVLKKRHSIGTKEVYLTSMGRISIDVAGEELPEEVCGDLTGSATPVFLDSATVTSDPALLRERVQGAELDEWQDDSITDIAERQERDDLSELGSVTSDESSKKKIVPDISIDDEDDDDDDYDKDDDDDDDEDTFIGDLEWEKRRLIQTDDAATKSRGSGAQAAGHGVTSPVTSPEAPYSPDGSAGAEGQYGFMKVSSSRGEFTIDLQAIEPYKKVVGHGGYQGEGLAAIIVFYGCHLPSRSKEPNYTYVMEHLFHYVIHTLDGLVAEDYIIVYFHGSTPRKQMPGLGWLKRCYQSIDRRLKKHLKGLLLVHPTLFLKTVVTMIKPFISFKFSSKLKFVKTLEELNGLLPLQKVEIPEAIVQLDEKLQMNPHFLEEQDARDQSQVKADRHKVKAKAKEEKQEKKEEKKRKDEEKKKQKAEKKEEKKRDKEQKKALKKKK